MVSRLLTSVITVAYITIAECPVTICVDSKVSNLLQYVCILDTKG